MKIRDEWFVVYRPVLRPALRLFCFPFAGSGALVFRDWSSHLPPEMEVCAVQLPGREGRFKERPYTRLSDLVQDLAEVFAPYSHLPYAFFGHSMGALVAFALAREMRRRHLPTPALLMVSGHRAPQRPDPDPPIHDLPEPDFLQEIRELNGTPEAVLANPELLELVMPVLRADFEVCETYKYEEETPLACPISAFGGTEDADVPREDIAAWSYETTGPFTLRMFSGDHFYFLDQPANLMRHVIADVKGCLDQPQAARLRSGLS
jgi:medium-chain acyl-[acyl-carrier-protein] hydrolase